MHNIELKKLGSIKDMIQIVFVQRNDHFMIAALPIRVAAGIDDVGLEVVILTVNAWDLWDAESDKWIWWFHLVDRVKQAHGRYDIDR